jgi:hypothetical protein
MVAPRVLAAPPDPPIVRDVWLRQLNDYKITLVDWEGQMANPALELRIEPPTNAEFPSSVTIAANGARLYFDDAISPTNLGANGPTKTLDYVSAVSYILYISIFPDRDALDEDYALTVTFTDANGTSQTVVPIHVVDQDKSLPLDFNVALDFSKDQSQFFTHPQSGALRRSIIKQAADDWAYFIGNMNLDTVGAGQQQTYIWNYPDAFHIGGNGAFIANAAAYKGFLLYVYGITCTMPTICPDTTTIRSGGVSSSTGAQSTGGLPRNPNLRRSGTVEIETQGNYNLNGWFLTLGDNDWFLATNYATNDLYSIAHHEIGHALAFNDNYPAFNTAALSTQSILAYNNNTPLYTDSSDHFYTSIDRASRYGAFGNEYNPDGVPTRRWLITKLDILALEAVGYTKRVTSAFTGPVVNTGELPDGVVGAPYNFQLEGKGGIPFYKWAIAGGSLPTGLYLNDISGVIGGVPNTAGSYTFDVEICDYDSPYVANINCNTTPFTVVIGATPGSATPERNYFTTTTPTLTWNRLSNVLGYQVQVASDAAFAKLVFERDDLPNTALAVTTQPLDGGRYYWRVRAKLTAATWGSWSSVESFLVSLP